MQNEARREVERGNGDVELVARARIRVGEDVCERGAKLAAGARDQDVLRSRSERIGDVVL